MGAPETPIMFACRAAIMRTGLVMGGRNNVGVTKDTHVRYGFGLGSPDLIFILKPLGRFFCLEIKAPGGRLSKEQIAWHKAARAFGAFVAVVHSTVEALAALERAIAGACE
jgi:hypothetical protein